MTKWSIAAGFLAAALLPAPAFAQKGGTVTGQALWTGGAIPKNEEANVDKDKASCLRDGAILKNELVIDPKTKGIKNVIVWLTDADPKKINVPFADAAAKAWLAKNTTVEIDQPCCAFIPRIVPIVEGQKLLVRNSATIAHNISVLGGSAGPNFNQLMPPGTKFEHAGPITARIFPIGYSCSIHAWMKGYLFAIPSPYYAVTGPDGKFTLKDVPPGKYRLMAWQEKGGFLLLGPGGVAKKDRGVVIEVKAGENKAPKVEIAKVDD